MAPDAPTAKEPRIAPEPVAIHNSDDNGTTTGRVFVKACARCGEVREHGGRRKGDRVVPQPYCPACKVILHAAWRHGSGCEQFAAAVRRTRARYPERTRARHAVTEALRSGKITRQPCITCGSPDTEAHHDDYTKPLAVTWVCRAHHRALDRARRAVA